MKIIPVKGFPSIYEVDSFEKEFRKATDEKPAIDPPFRRYQSWLIERLVVLEQYGTDILQFPRHFEKLKGEDDLYSMRYPRSKKNPRVIFIYFNGSKVLLLTAFAEKSTKDYDNAIKLARKRLKELGV